MGSWKRSSERALDSQLWHACAGGMVELPPINSQVIYFPQGHTEHAQGKVDFGHIRYPPLIPCRLSAIKYMADPETDEVYAKMRLIPLRGKEFDEFEEDCLVSSNGMESQEKPSSFAKTLTQSDANNGGGFSVPRYCAETIFPKLDYSAEPPVQTIIAKDVHGHNWKFRHIYRGTPRRHLLTTGWSNFVNQKKLVAGDSIVFLRADNGDLCVGIRRAKKGIGGGVEYSYGENYGTLFGGNCSFKNENLRAKGQGGELVVGRVTPESVIEAVTLAVNGQPFEVIYYPRASAPEFCVRASLVKASMGMRWCSGMRFKMPFETEDSSRISWFMGTISAVQVADPIQWPNSPWRLLQVVWDEPELLQNVLCVSPWLVELVSNAPTYHLSPFSPPRKKTRFLKGSDYPNVDQFPMQSFPSKLLNHNSSLCSINDNILQVIQGARHNQFGPTSSDLHFTKCLPGIIQDSSFRRPPERSTESNESLSCLLTVGNHPQNLKEKKETKTPHLLLFGKLILPVQQNSNTSSGDTVGNTSSDENSEKTTNLFDGSGSTLHQVSSIENSSEGGYPNPSHKDHRKSELGGDTSHCKVFMESEDVDRKLDLSLFGSYNELYGKFSNMFGIEIPALSSTVMH